MINNNASNQLPAFLVGLALSVVFVAAFFLGAWADRVFVIKPLDRLAPHRVPTPVTLDQDGVRPEVTRLSDLLTDSQYTIADIADLASESVVTVAIKQRQAVLEELRTPVFGLPQFRDTGEIEEIQRDIGSGFVVEGDLIVTNKHVVADPGVAYLVIDRNDAEYQVSRIYRDPVNDLAILEVENMSLPVLPLGDSDSLRVGEQVIVIGTALGQFRHTVTTGVVSGLGRGIQATDGFWQVETLEDVIQTDAAINPGNSGGPLLNVDGEVIGVSVAVSRSGQNIGFAIPINVVRASIDNFNRTGQFDRPFLGVRYQMISEQAALINEVPRGAYIVEVISESTAEVAGLREGDILVSFAGERLQDDADLAQVINNHSIGDRVNLEYFRQGEFFQTEVVLRGGW